MTSGVSDKIISTQVASECGPSGTVISRNGVYKSWNGRNSPVGGPKRENPYTMITINQIDDSVIVESTLAGVKVYKNCTVQSASGYASAPPKPSYANAFSSAFNNLIEDIEGNAFNGAVFLAEAKDSLSQITDTAKNIAKFLHFLKLAMRSSGATRITNLRAALDALGVSGNISSIPSELSAAWLATSYGWAPLISDITEALKALDNTLGKDMSITHNGYGQEQNYTSLNIKPPPGQQAPKDKKPAKSRTHSVKLRAKHVAKGDGTSGFQNLPSILWEKTPYSFVADWFIPVGSYLEARGHARQADLGEVSETIVDKYKLSRAENDKIFGGYNAEFSSFSLQRIIHTNGIPDSDIPAPEFKSLMEVPSFRKAITSLALLNQAFAK